MRFCAERDAAENDVEKAKEDVTGVREQIMRITAELVGGLDKRHDDLKVRNNLNRILFTMPIWCRRQSTDAKSR